MEEKKAEAEVLRRGGSKEEVVRAQKAAINRAELHDAHLSSTGERQVRMEAASFERMLADTHYPLPEIAFVSPLTRTCETAMLLLPEQVPKVRSNRGIRL